MEKRGLEQVVGKELSSYMISQRKKIVFSKVASKITDIKGCENVFKCFKALYMWTNQNFVFTWNCQFILLLDIDKTLGNVVDEIWSSSNAIAIKNFLS